MTRKEFEPYFRDLADRMGLRDWLIFISPERPRDATDVANVLCWEGRKRATIRLSEDFLGDTPEDQRHTACHELIHCHFAAATHIAEQGLGNVQSAFMLNMEFGVDGMADAIAPHMPLPPTTAEKVEQ
jgi:hypothetical protein